MISFRLPASIEVNDRIRLWLWETIGPGGLWLGKDEPAENDLWGVWHDLGCLRISFVKDRHATLYKLRWS
jgi:hypothetical protein